MKTIFRYIIICASMLIAFISYANAAEIDILRPTDGALVLITASGEKTVPLQWSTKLPPPYQIELVRVGSHKLVSNFVAQQQKFFTTLPVGHYVWRVRSNGPQGISAWSAESTFEISPKKEKDAVPVARIVSPTENQPVKVADASTSVQIRTILFPPAPAKYFDVQVSRSNNFTESLIFDERVKTDTVDVKLDSGTYYVRVRARVDKRFTEWATTHFEVQTSDVWAHFSSLDLAVGGIGSQNTLKTDSYLGPLATSSVQNAKFSYQQILWKWNSLSLNATYQRYSIDGTTLSTNFDQVDLTPSILNASASLRTFVYHSSSFSRLQFFFDLEGGKRTLQSLFADSSSPTAKLEGPIIKSQSALAIAMGGGIGTIFSLRATDRHTIRASFEMTRPIREFAKSTFLNVNYNMKSQLSKSIYYYVEPFYSMREHTYSGTVTGSATESEYGVWLGIGFHY